ncbi:MAG: hypothetical protein ACYC1D_00350 [Acidimicrobiales bacterium]
MEAYRFAEPVGLDPHHPDEPEGGYEPGVDGRAEQWWEGPAWSHRRPAHRRVELPEGPEPGWDVDL